MTPPAAGSNSSVQPAAASLASVAESTISSSTPASLGDAGAERLGVLRRAARRRGDEPRAHHAARAHLVPADQQRLDRARNRRLADPPRSGNAFAEANDAGKRVDDAKPAGGRACDEEPAIVGAEVERRVGCIVVWVQRSSHFIAESTVAADAVGRPASPAGPPSRRPVPTAVAARPGLLVHNHLPAAPELSFDGSTWGEMYQARPTGPILCFSRL